jgi:hypothetical protein
LLEQLEEADAAQASNLGQALVPAIATRFQELTQRRYQTVQLTARPGTEGVMISGALRSAAQISVGTREQFSTLYRLSLAEYLRTVLALDDHYLGLMLIREIRQDTHSDAGRRASRDRSNIGRLDRISQVTNLESPLNGKTDAEAGRY